MASKSQFMWMKFIFIEFLFWVLEYIKFHEMYFQHFLWNLKVLVNISSKLISISLLDALFRLFSRQTRQILFSFVWKSLQYKVKHLLSSGYSGITFPCLPKDALPSPLPTAAKKGEKPAATWDQQTSNLVFEAQQRAVTQSAELSTTGKKQNKKIDILWIVDTKRMNKTSHWPREPSS